MENDTIEPHSLILSGREFNEFEEKLFVITMNKLFPFMNKDINFLTDPKEIILKGFPLDENKDTYINITVKELSVDKGFAKTFKKLEKALKKFIHIYRNDEVVAFFPLFSFVEKFKGYYHCKFSTEGLRYLLYFGKTEGASFYNIMAALNMNSAVQSRLYRFLKSNQNNGKCSINIDTLAQRFNVTTEYKYLKRYVLDAFLKRLDGNEYCDITASYEPYYVEEYRTGRRKVLGVTFDIKSK